MDKVIGCLVRSIPIAALIISIGYLIVFFILKNPQKIDFTLFALGAIPIVIFLPSVFSQSKDLNKGGGSCLGALAGGVMVSLSFSTSLRNFEKVAGRSFSSNGKSAGSNKVWLCTALSLMSGALLAI